MCYEERACQLLKFLMSQEVKKGLFAALTIESSQNIFWTYFQKPTWFYLLTTKDNLMGKVWGKTFLWCERPWTTLTEITTSLIHSSVRDWLDNPLNAADIDHVEFRVCLVSEPLDRVVFSNFCTLREKCFILQLFSKWKRISVWFRFFFFMFLWIINLKLRVNNICLRLRQITQT